jgi:hypothetical protein
MPRFGEFIPFSVSNDTEAIEGRGAEVRTYRPFAALFGILRALLW